MSENESLMKTGNYWIGYYNGSYIIHPFCPYDYCLSPAKGVVNLNVINGADAQCALNRSGLLCGQCTESVASACL